MRLAAAAAAAAAAALTWLAAPLLLTALAGGVAGALADKEPLRFPRLLMRPSAHVSRDVQTSYVMADNTGHAVVCSLTRAPDDVQEWREQQPSPSKSFDQEKFVAKLQSAVMNECVSEPLSNQWWRVTWCSHREITQAHRQGANDVLVHSLGKFHTKSIYFDAQSNEALFYRETFVAGSFCDEIKKARTAEARLFCCSSTGADDVEFLWFLETSLCQYVVGVCWPGACDVGLVDINALPSPVLALMMLSDMCFKHSLSASGSSGGKEGGGGAAATTAANAKENLVLCIDKTLHVNDVLIGKFDATGAFAKELFEKLGESPVADDRLPGLWHQGDGTLIHAYVQGRRCGANGWSSALVKFSCFAVDVRAPFIAVVHNVDECTMILHVHAPSLCRRPERRKKEDVMVLECV